MRTDKPLNKIIDEFISDCNINNQSRTNYRQTLRLFVLWLTKQGKDVRNVRRADIIEYKDWLITQNKSSYTVDNYLASIRQFYKWCDVKDYHDDVAYNIRSPKRDRKFRKTPLSKEQVVQMLSLCDNTIKGKRDYALLTLMIQTGMRRVEVSRLNIGDIIQEDGVFMAVIQRKGQVEKHSRIALINTTIDAINDYLVDRNNTSDDCALFINHAIKSNGNRMQPQVINKTVKQYMKAIGLHGHKYTAHSLRHTAACLMLEAGASVKAVQSMLGHSNLLMTEIYSGMITERMNIINPPANQIKEVFKNALKTRENGIKTHALQT